MMGNDSGLAEKALKHAQSLDSGNGNIGLALALLIKARGAYDEAITELKKSASLMDDPGQVWRELGDLYYEIKDYPLAKVQKLNF